MLELTCWLYSLFAENRRLLNEFLRWSRKRSLFCPPFQSDQTVFSRAAVLFSCWIRSFGGEIV